MRRWLSWLLLGIFLSIGVVAHGEPKIPPVPQSGIYVQDYANVLSGQNKSRINDISSKLAAKTKAGVVVVTVTTTGDTPIDEYALAILRQWGIGDKKLNNGVILLVATSDKKQRIEVGYGLEGALPDAKVGQILDEQMLPYSSQGDYDKGIMNAYLALVSAAAKEYNLEIKTDAKSQQVKTQNASEPSWWDTAPWWLKIILVGGALILVVVDFAFFGGSITFFILSMLRFRGGGGGGGGGSSGYGGGSGGGGGASR